MILTHSPGLQTSPCVYGGSCYRRLPPLITRMSDVLLLPSSTTTIKLKSNYSTLIILLIWKTQMLRRQMAVSDEQTAVWVALKAQTGGKHMLTTQRQRWAKISTINISSLLWSGWFQNLVYTHSQWSLELVDLYIMFIVPRFAHFRYLHWFCSNFLCTKSTMQLSILAWMGNKNKGTSNQFRNLCNFISFNQEEWTKILEPSQRELIRNLLSIPNWRFQLKQSFHLIFLKISKQKILLQYSGSI